MLTRLASKSPEPFFTIVPGSYAPFCCNQASTASAPSCAVRRSAAGVPAERLEQRLGVEVVAVLAELAHEDGERLRLHVSDAFVFAGAAERHRAAHVDSHFAQELREHVAGEQAWIVDSLPVTAPRDVVTDEACNRRGEARPAGR